jgi:CheY-like chemotaxis protein
MARASMLAATETFSADVDGETVVVHQGERVRSSHPVVKGREHLFEPAESRVDVDQATAAPGEKRGGRRAARAHRGRKEKGASAPSRWLTSGAMPIRVVLADDSVAVRDALAQILNRSADIDLVATADDEPTLLAAIEETRPDVVVTDVRMPPTGSDEGVRIAERLATAQPEIGVVIVSVYSDPEWLSRVFDQGTENRGWVMKHRAYSQRQLINAVKTVHQGDRWIDPSATAPD